MNTIPRLSLLVIAMSMLAGRLPAQVGTAPASVLRIVNQIEFTGNTIIPTSELMNIINIKPGELLTTAKLDRATTAIEQAYRRRGYLAVVTDDIVGQFQETGTLTFPVVEAKVAEVKITGLHKTRGLVVRRMLELKPGDLYYIPALNRDADRIISLGIFESVDADVQPTEKSGGVIITWKIVEREKTGDIRLGGSYAPSDKLILDVTYTESNFRGRAEQLGLTANIGTIKSRLGGEVSYMNPWIGRDRSLTLRGFSNFRYRFAQDLTATSGRYFERTRGGQISTTKTLSAVRRFTLGTRFENVTADNLPFSILTPHLANANGKIATVSGTLAVDRRDSSVYPTTGRLWRASIEPGWSNPLAEDTTFIVKGTGQLQRYYPLDRVPTIGPQRQSTRRPRVLAGRLSSGSSAGRLPFFEQFFVGGVNGMRGYDESRFWGKHMILGQAEYRQPIGRSLTALGFVDAGDAWGSRFQFDPGAPTKFDQHKSFSPRAGAGVGLRYNTSYGPLGLDFGWGEGFHTYLVLGPVF